MTNYVLEILDGDQAGESVALTGSRITIGRKAGNDLVVHDEKVSGQHAEVVLEGDRWVVRDLGSTNGTSMDGGRITEVALTPFDVVTFGRVRVVFKAEGESAPPLDDLQLARLDASALKRTKRGSAAMVAGVVVVLAGAGVAAWLQFFGGEQVGGPSVQAPLKVGGNRLPAGADDFEDEGPWDLQAGGGGFDLTVGRARCNTGRTAVEAAHRRGEDGAEARWSLARLSDPLNVPSGTRLALSAHVRTGGGGRAALRLRFASSVEGTVATAGCAPFASPDGFTASEPWVVTVPRAMDQVSVELLALHPATGDEVLIDDVALVLARDGEAHSADLSSANGRNLSAVGGTLWVTSGDDVVLAGVEPITGAAPFPELAAAGLLTPSDVGASLSVEAADGGFGVAFDPGEARGIGLVFPASSANVMAKSGDGAFLEQPPDFTGEGVTEVLLGSGNARCLIALAGGAEVRGERRGNDYRLLLPGSYAFDLRVAWDEATQRARELVREARIAERAGELAKALDHVEEVVTAWPHDDRTGQEARQLRAELGGRIRERTAFLQREAAEASFFNARVGYQRVAAGIEELIATYGVRHVDSLDALRALSARMNEQIAALDAQAADQHGERLRTLESALGESGQERLAAVVGDYLRRYYEGQR